MDQSIILGIGSGRCGTRSLADVLNRQPDLQVSHEALPLLPWRRETGQRVIRRRFARFRQTRGGRILGDVASFYLPYIEDAIAVEPNIRIVCLKRPREEVVRSFCDWLDGVHPLPTNHWARNPASGWYHEPIWTRTFPQYDTPDREEGIRRYWDEYYGMAGELVRRFPENIRVFETDFALNTETGQQEMLAFAGVETERQVLAVGTRVHKKPRSSASTNRSRDREQPLSPRRCVVLVPVAGQVHPKCERGLTELERRGYTVRRVAGYAAIDQGRNQLATDALVAGFEETMWIDADIGFDPDAVERLRAHGLPIVCGIYPQKAKRELACHVMPGTKQIVFGQAGGLTELQYAATGFLLVRRRVYETIQQALGLPVCNERFGSPTIPFFQPMVHNRDDGRWYLAEDYAFCQRARQCGFKIMADTSIRLWHVGSYSYGWEDAGLQPQRFGIFTLNLLDQQGKQSE